LFSCQKKYHPKARCPNIQVIFPKTGIGSSLAFGSSSPFPEVFQAKELESRKDLGDNIIFKCPLCQVFLDIKEKS
jgi:hypothetical protein